MMARSGGFNVPADYFKQPQRHRPGHAPPPQSRSGRIVPWIAGTAAAVGIVGAIFAIGPHRQRQPAPAEPVASAADRRDRDHGHRARARAGRQPASTPVAVAANAERRRGLPRRREPRSEPGRRGGARGQSRRGAGEAGRLRVTAQVLDGKESKLIVRLDCEKPAAGSRPRPPATEAAAPAPQPEDPKAKPKPPVGGGEIVNPWAK